MIKAIILDLGGVLNVVHFFAFYKLVCAKYKLDIEEFHEVESKLRHHLDEGDGNLDWFFDHLGDHFKVNFDRDWYLKTLRSKVEWNDELFYFLKDIKSKVDIYVLSNTSLLFEDENQKELLSHICKDQFYSFELRKRKPAKETYERVVEKLGIKFSDCIYVDDKGKNLIPPYHMGIHTYHYRTNKSFFRYLKEML